MSTDSPVIAAFGTEAIRELTDSLEKIKHCIDQLDDDQLWWRPAESMNSIANLMLHISGNLRQWIVAGVGGANDTRHRQSEFDARGPMARSAVVERIEDAVEETRATLSSLTEASLLEPRRIQGFDVSGMQAIWASVAHFRGHTQEIVHMTRSQLGEAYRFDFIPTTPEQGA